MVTHTDISDRLRQIDAEVELAHSKADKERESLRELCSGIGHVFGAPQPGMTVDDSGAIKTHQWRVCTVCGHCEQV